MNWRLRASIYELKHLIHCTNQNEFQNTFKRQIGSQENRKNRKNRLWSSNNNITKTYYNNKIIFNINVKGVKRLKFTLQIKK
jgi:hypothetical protein